MFRIHLGSNNVLGDTMHPELELFFVIPKERGPDQLRSGVSKVRTLLRVLRDIGFKDALSQNGLLNAVGGQERSQLQNSLSMD